MKKYIGIVYINGEELFILIDARSIERANLIMQASFKDHESGPLALLEPNEEEGVSHEMWSANG